MSRNRVGAASLATAGVLFVLYPAIRPWHDESTVSGATTFMSSPAWVAAHFFAVLGFILVPLGLLAVGDALARTRSASLALTAAVAYLDRHRTDPAVLRRRGLRPARHCRQARGQPDRAGKGGPLPAAGHHDLRCRPADAGDRRAARRRRNLALRHPAPLRRHRVRGRPRALLAAVLPAAGRPHRARRAHRHRPGHTRGEPMAG